MLPHSNVTIKEGTSLKRVSLKTGHRTHQIAAFPNTQGVIVADTLPLGKYLNENSTNTDFMSFVTAARVLGMIEYAAGGEKELQKGLSYGILPGSFPITEDDVAIIHDREEFNEAVRSIDEMTPEWVKTESLSIALASATAAVTDDDEVTVEYGVGGLARPVASMSTALAMGSIHTILSAGLTQAPSLLGVKRRRIARSDEASGTGIRDAATAYRRYCNSLRMEEASLLVFLEQLYLNMPKQAPEQLILAGWNEIGPTLERTIPTWPIAFDNARNCVLNLGGKLGKHASLKLWGSEIFSRSLA
jgi:hypothetical protein